MENSLAPPRFWGLKRLFGRNVNPAPGNPTTGQCATPVRLGCGGMGAGLGFAPKGAAAAVHDALVRGQPPGVKVAGAIRVRHAAIIAGWLCAWRNADGLDRAHIAARGEQTRSTSGRDLAGIKVGRGGNSCTGRKEAAEPDPGPGRLARGQPGAAQPSSRGMCSVEPATRRACVTARR